MRRPMTLACVALTTATALVLSGCGGATSSGSTETVAVDVGNGTPITLPTGPLKVGVFISGAGTAWNEAFSRGAVEAAEQLGWTADVVSPNFDLTTQINQAQTAASSHQYDAVIIEPIASAQLCTAYSKALPQANVLVVSAVTPICDKSLETGDAMWSEGTLTHVGGEATIDYVRAFMTNAIEQNPGPQKVLFVTGPELDPLSIMDKQAVGEFAATHPDFQVKDLLYTDWTTPTATRSVTNYLQANPDVTLVLSAYSPDTSRGILNGIDAVGRSGQIRVADNGGTAYSVEQIKAGAIQMSVPFFPAENGRRAVQAIADAQAGKAVPRFVSTIPAEFGSVTAPVVITKDNVATFSPSY